MTEQQNKLIIFQSKKIRRAWHDYEWSYSLVDMVAALTGSANPTDYLKKIRKRDEELGFYIGTACPQVEMLGKSGEKRKVLAGKRKDIFRLIQSIPSKQAEPFKRWLAKVGQERIDEIENPELAQERMKAIYEQKGYPSDWIDKRLRGMAIRQNLTDEWKERGIEEYRDFAILTEEISKATFGVTRRQGLINSMNANNESRITNPSVGNLINSVAIACNYRLGVGDSESHELPFRINQHLPANIKS